MAKDLTEYGSRNYGRLFAAILAGAEPPTVEIRPCYWTKEQRLFLRLDPRPR